MMLMTLLRLDGDDREHVLETTEYSKHGPLGEAVCGAQGRMEETVIMYEATAEAVELCEDCARTLGLRKQRGRR